MDKWTVKVIVLLVMITIVVLLWFGFDLNLSRRQVFEPHMLLATNPEFPTEWDMANVGPVRIDWDESETIINVKEDAVFGDISSAQRSWTDNGTDVTSPRIVQKVFSYNNPFIAAVYYIITQPESVRRDVWPNFSNPDNKSKRYPVKEMYESPYADSEEFVCAMGNPSKCQMWYYWARYGQYILMVTYFGPSQGVNEGLFGNIVDEIDKLIDPTLE